MSALQYESLGFTDIIVRLEDGVAILTLNRAKQRNTWSISLVNELIKAFDLFNRDDRVRVVILTAEPTAPSFCSGADISRGWGGMFSEEVQHEGPHAHRDTGGLVSLAILRCRKITIVAVNGHAVGVGMTALQLPFDFRFIWGGAKLALPFVRRGVSPEAISTYLLPRLIGHSRATALMLSGATVSPDSPLLQGLYHEIHPTRDAVFPAALAFGKELAANTSQGSIAVTKGLLWRGADTPEGQFLLDSRAIQILGMSGDAEEGAKAFKERRPVNFKETLSKNLPNWFPWWTEVDVKHRKAKL
ncbi:peroxisomal enoyl-CoA-hydratase [Cristinia sonorae]|uniref:Peroxisomal enoyl-CoA-hydratase n=1 Tax=Cristinia sonorae TaxID=1940300 RepID=A0A8K0XQF0_9AGAR|nr:peroxisomal enoyl-CoA-hydratase [Cristinia sonorae]